MKKKVLITGSRGFLGSNLSNHFGDSSELQHFRVIDHDRTKCDLMTSPSEVSSYFDLTRPDYVVHCAAACGGLLANKGAPGDMMVDNLVMTANVLRACVENDVERVTLIGTPCSYAVDAPLPLKEADLGKNLSLANATGAYGIAKWTTWQMAEAYGLQYGLSFNYVVPGNMFGPGDNFSISSGHVVAAMVRKFLENSTMVSLIGPQTDTRDLIYVGDVCRAIALLVDTETEGRPLNVSSGYETSVFSLANLIKELTDSEATIVWENRPELARHSRRCMDVSAIRDLVGWRPEVGLRAGLCRTINWCRRHCLGR